MQTVLTIYDTLLFFPTAANDLEVFRLHSCWKIRWIIDVAFHPELYIWLFIRCNVFDGIIVLLAQKRGSIVVLISEIPLTPQSTGISLLDMLYKKCYLKVNVAACVKCFSQSPNQSALNKGKRLAIICVDIDFSASNRCHYPNHISIFSSSFSVTPF